MVLKITEFAEDKFTENCEYLVSEWNYKVLKNFIEEFERIQELLKLNPKLGMFDEELGLYKILIVKQIYIFYTIKNNELTVVNFWNNNKNPYWL